MFLEVMCLEGYTVDVTKTAAEAISLLEHQQGAVLILMDNFVVNEEALQLVSALRAQYGLRARVAIIGADIFSGGIQSPVATLYDLDAHIMLPPTVDSMFNILESTWQGLWQEQPSKN
jgi:CheY-like chemotaxis protein